MSQTGVLQALTNQLELSGLKLELWAYAWARLVPTIVLVPAFGAKLIPAPARAILGFALAAVIAPALQPLAASELPWLWRIFQEIGRGLPVALSTAALLWAASMAGGLVDDLRGGPPASRVALLEGNSSVLGSLLGLFMAIVFLKLGGPARVLEALAVADSTEEPLLRAVETLVRAIHIAIGLACPMLTAVLVWDSAAALIARAASPAHIQVALAPIRALVVMAALALVLDGLLSMMVSLF